jgi:glycosyltransferase involved in cell wall biosynthesis
MVGKEDYFYQRLKEFAGKSGVGKQVIFPGFVTDQDLPCLYQNSRLYVFPSFCEGFGLPPLEAMSYGIPVAASQASSLPEILGEAAYLFNPHHEEEIEQTIEKLLIDETLRNKLIQKGFERIKLFNWRKMAEATHSLYMSV